MSERPFKIAPSIFAADMFNLSLTVDLFEKSKVDMIHYDIMDGRFVPNISFGSKLIEDVSSRTNLPSNVHLMVDIDTIRRLDSFIKLPIQNITIHFEASQKYIIDCLNKIKKSGKDAGISIKPNTAVEAVLPYLDIIDLILLMSVEPGFSGQKFLPSSIERLQKLKTIVGGKKIDIQVDGGINRNNYKQLLLSGANFLVIGTEFYKDKDPAEWVESIKGFSAAL